MSGAMPIAKVRCTRAGGAASTTSGAASVPAMPTRARSARSGSMGVRPECAILVPREERLMEPPTDDAVWGALRTVNDPEVGMNVVDLGLVYAVAVQGADVRVELTMTSPACPLGD